MRQIISTGLVALIVGALAGATVSAVAQSPAQSPAEPVIEPAAGLNADTVDGRHAVGAGASKAKRARKLVATNASGFLPSNIVKPKWNLIRGKPAAFADGQIGWGEVQNKPAGFADGVDNVGVRGITITRVAGPTITIGTEWHSAQDVDCPTGSYAVGGGVQTHGDFDPHPLVAESYPLDADTWAARVYNPSSTFVAEANTYVVCLAVKPSSAVTIAKRG